MIPNGIETASVTGKRMDRSWLVFGGSGGGREGVSERGVLVSERVGCRCRSWDTMPIRKVGYMEIT